MAILIVGLSHTMFAQDLLNTTGASTTGAGGSVSYSVGQISYATNTSTEGSVLQGVQQAYEILEIIEEPVKNGATLNNISLTLSAYPNTNGNLLLNIERLDGPIVLFKLFDLHGNLLRNICITNTQTNIDMSDLAPATYFAKVIQGRADLKAFKVLKK